MLNYNLTITDTLVVKNELTLRSRLLTIKCKLQVCREARLLLSCCILPYREM